MLKQKFIIMRNLFKFMLFVALGAILFVSCEEDKFTEKEAMESLQTIDVALTVQNGSSPTENVEGATVQLVKDSSTVEKTTDASGNVVFTDMPVGGNISVYVNKENFTKAMYQVSTSTESYRTNQISQSLKIYPLSGDNLATVKGQLTIETDLTNRKREKLANQEVRIVNNGLSSNLDRSFIGTTDSEGKYSIKVPVNPDGGDDLSVHFPSEIDTTQTLAMEANGNYEVVTKPTVYYSSGYDPSNIQSIPSAKVTIGEPNDVGSGFELDVEAKGTPFSSYSQIELIQGGSGYEKDTIVELSAGINGNHAEVMIDVNTANGDPDSSSIQNVYPSSDNGALYTSEPTLDLSDLSGSGAKIDIRFESEYLVYIKDYGTDYQSIPTVSASYREYDGETIVKEIDEDLDDYENGAYNEIDQYQYRQFRNYLNLYDGSIYPSNNAYDGDTLFVTKGLTELPELSISTSTGQQAIIKLNQWDINSSDSTITDFYMEQNGQGYDPANPPQVNINSLAGYGSGAEFYVEVNSDGTIYNGNIEIVDGGNGYVPNVNDYNNRYPQWTGDVSNVGPGESRIANFYYGTGKRKEEE